jgi:hypothetical protein
LLPGSQNRAGSSTSSAPDLDLDEVRPAARKRLANPGRLDREPEAYPLARSVPFAVDLVLHVYKPSIAVKAATAARPIAAGSALQGLGAWRGSRRKDQCSGQGMGRPRIAFENPLNAGIGLGIACLSDAPISEGNMGTNAKHFNGIATALADGVHPISAGGPQLPDPLLPGSRRVPAARHSSVFPRSRHGAG